ncbi:ABC transporter permease [Bordetella sp. 02P26C-1]|uniref:ABC transporter permease n=1 Tax=Bordetella sp. 02P26C-1 TaxID=2683195 RepID=UPI001355947B|nr:ABC transporter permease [Bordetella sp. 02P26C-1]MVW78655.1 ABC transporter permease subunit [Bordetella sp. 02P26C-1]
MPYLIRRLVATIPVMVIVAVFVFFLAHMSPGDPAAVLAGDNATVEDVEKIRAAMGLDKPLVEQFLHWGGNVLRGDLGVSTSTKMPVLTLIHQRMGPTLSIALFTILLAVFLAVPLGVIAAWKAGSLTDRLIMLGSVVAFSIPVFLIGYGLAYVFSVKLGVLPVQGYKPMSDGLATYARHLVLPCVSLGLVYMALLTRMTRATMLEALGEDYIRTARAKGLDSRLIIWHALKNAANPIVTTIGVGIAMLIGGVVVTETVFAIPGLGRLTVDAVLRHDYPVIQGVLLISSAVYVLINLLVDLSYRIFDPRMDR